MTTPGNPAKAFEFRYNPGGNKFFIGMTTPRNTAEAFDFKWNPGKMTHNLPATKPQPKDRTHKKMLETTTPPPSRLRDFGAAREFYVWSPIRRL